MARKVRQIHRKGKRVDLRPVPFDTVADVDTPIAR